MKNYKALILSGAMLVFAGAAADAQIIYTTTDGMTQGQVMMNIYADNARAAAAQAAMTGANPAMLAALKAERLRIEKAGAAKIAAGKAGLSFTSTTAGTEITAKKLTWDADQPTLESQVAYIKKTIGLFEQLMAQNGFKPKDAADGYAFAYALSYAAYHNRDMSKSELEALREKDRQGGLKNPYFQGMSEVAKQSNYEIDALMAMQAVKYRAKYRHQATAAEKPALAEKAQTFANTVLKLDKD